MQVTKEIVSVSEMARMLGLSRARLYQLIKEGVFPPPTQAENGGRPFYDRQQQEQCVTVRRTNCGIDGRPILFYAMRETSTDTARPVVRPSPQRRSTVTQPNRDDATISLIRHGLSQLGLSQINEQDIRAALAETHPDGWSGVDPAALLRAVFEQLNRRDSNDNVSR